MKKIKIKQLLMHMVLIPFTCLPAMAINYVSPEPKPFTTTTTITSLTPTTFANGDGGGVHTFNYTDLEALAIDFDFIDNSVNIEVNGTPLHSEILEMEVYEFGSGEVQILFQSDSGEMDKPWLPNTNGLPRVRLEIDSSGNVSLVGTRYTDSTILEVLDTDNGSSFNTINFPTGASTVTITNIDESGLDSISGTITPVEASNTAGSWNENGSTLYYNTGNVAVNTTNVPVGYSFAVKGKIIAEELKIQVSPWADFVFKEGYQLPTLKEVEQHIKENGHLQHIPSAREVAKHGIYVGQMDAKLLRKIEELTLYTIAQEKKIQELEESKRKNNLLKRRLDKLEKVVYKN